MAEPVFAIDPETLLFDGEALKRRGAELHDRYAAAAPYPHICLDGAFPTALLDRVREETAAPDAAGPGEGARTFNADHELKKTQTIPERLPAYTRNVFYALNARPFLGFLEALTGIRGLIPDPYFIGGGLHETQTGGFLAIHADFNHHKALDLERRLNVLVYLNPDWSPDYGGCFEIWDTKMTTQHAKIEPLFNRMVIFSTGSDTMHGNPEPVNHPEGLPRRSLALYYYTATWDETRRGHSTVFRARPGTGDASAAGHRVNRVLDDVLPPILNRQVKRVRRRIGL